jgi:hypothetical protein
LCLQLIAGAYDFCMHCTYTIYGDEDKEKAMERMRKLGYM